MVKISKSLLYLPASQKRDITNTALSALDQALPAVNFRDEIIIVTLILQKL